MIPFNIIEFICDNASANSLAVKAIINHALCRNEEIIANRILDMLITKDNEFVEKYNITPDENKIKKFLSQNTSQNIISINKVDITDIVSGKFCVTYSYNRIKWYSDPDCKGERRYYKGEQYVYPKIDDEVLEVTCEVDYLTTDVLV